MSHYTTLCKNGKQTRDFWGVFILFLSIFYILGAFLIKQLFIRYEIGYSQLGPTGLVGYLPSHIQRALME